MTRTVHVLWSANTGPLVAYLDASLAFAHARTMLCVEVSSVELRDSLPDHVRDDIAAEHEEDETTPVESRTRTIELDDIDDADKGTR